MFFKFDIIKSVTFFRKILSLHFIKLKNNGIVIKGDNKFFFCNKFKESTMLKRISCGIIK